MFDPTHVNHTNTGHFGQCITVFEKAATVGCLYKESEIKIAKLSFVANFLMAATKVDGQYSCLSLEKKLKFQDKKRSQLCSTKKGPCRAPFCDRTSV